jgi:hypothetical protein
MNYLKNLINSKKSKIATDNAETIPNLKKKYKNVVLEELNKNPQLN